VWNAEVPIEQPKAPEDHKLKVTISEGMQLTGGYVGTDLDI